MNLNGRVTRLESSAYARPTAKYRHVATGDGHGGYLPADPEKGFRIEPYDLPEGATGSAAFYLATWAEVEAFAAQPGVDLHIVHNDHDDRETTGVIEIRAHARQAGAQHG
jgi:hypothetical protein